MIPRAAYAWTGAAAVDRGYTANGLNQYTAITGLSSLSYDANANLTSDGVNTYVYDVENRLVTRSGGATATLRYDPLGRLYEVTGSSGTRRFLYDGDDLVAEYNSSGTLLRRYVHGLGAGDDPQVWFEGSGVSDAARRYLYTDERGSVTAVTDGSGNVLHINSYDEYGIPDSANIGTFGYTGQIWLPELGMNYYKARMYSPTLGRFMQTDPIGYGDGMNMYAYTHSDPVNGVDPSGLVVSSRPVQECETATSGAEGPSSVNCIFVFANYCDLACAQVNGMSLRARLGEGGWNQSARRGGIRRGEVSASRNAPQNDEDYCAGYSVFATARTAVGIAGDGAGALEDILSRTPAAVIPQAQGFMKGLKAIEAVGLGGGAAIGLYMGYRYGDWAAFAESAGSALAGGVVAGAYKRIANIVEPNRNNDLVADIIANVVPQGVNIKSSGRCAQ